MPLKAAKIKDEDFLAEVEEYGQDQKEFHLWWLGQSGFLLTWRGERILIDPYLSDSLTKKYTGTNKPHIRISERVVDPNLLRNISIVTSSHNHSDHLDAETLIPLIKNNPEIKLIIPEANREFVSERLQISKAFPIGLSDGRSISIGDFDIHGVAAKHNEIERDSLGNCKFMGYVICFAQWSIYHSGDTLWFEGLDEFVKPFHIDVALLPINGNDSTRGVAGNLNPWEAAGLGKSIGAGLVIPCHYDMFAFNTGDPRDLEINAKKISQPYCILEQGGHFSSRILNHETT
jgi:L-ascorbate metabolism protein UlaG (beta-lactamase superfamily)